MFSRHSYSEYTSRYFEWFLDNKQPRYINRQQKGSWTMITADLEILSPHCCNAHIWSVDELQFGSAQLMSLSRSNLGSNYNNVTSQTQVIPFGINGQWEVFKRPMVAHYGSAVCPICIVTLTMGQCQGLWQCSFAEIMIGFRVSKYGARIAAGTEI